MAEDTRKLVLARRARFIAAALAAAGVASTECGETKPQVCLVPALDGSKDDAASDAAGGVDGSKDAGFGTDSSNDTGPEPCLAPPPGDD